MEISNGLVYLYIVHHKACLPLTQDNDELVYICDSHFPKFRNLLRLFWWATWTCKGVAEEGVCGYCQVQGGNE